MDITQRACRRGCAGQTGGLRAERPSAQAVGFARAARQSSWLAGAVLGVLTLTCSLQAGAALGARAALASNTVSATAGAAGIARRSIAIADGGSVTEFSDASGLVFAVAWKSPVMPALETLLGAWAPVFTLAQQRQMQARRDMRGAPLLSLRRMAAQEGDLVVLSAGRPDAFWGYAYLRSAVPTGFDVTRLAQ